MKRKPKNLLLVLVVYYYERYGLRALREMIYDKSLWAIKILSAKFENNPNQIIDRSTREGRHAMRCDYLMDVFKAPDPVPFVKANSRHSTLQEVSMN